jgi:hypothetical protein
MKTVFLTQKSINIDRLNSDIERLTIEGYKVVDYKIVGSAVHDQYNQYTVIVVQLNQE